MLIRVDPLLSKIEALTEPGCYSLTFTLDGGEQRAVVLRVRGSEVIVPAANAFAGWSPDSGTYAATLEAVRAVHRAREGAGQAQGRLLDLAGGWDVSLGNVLLTEQGIPACVAHGELAATEPGVFHCPVCGAGARYASEPA